MARTFDIQIFRSIRQSFGRFLAIFLIVALGCGFYAGLRMTGPDMRWASDAWFDGTALYDVEVLSSLGLTQRQIDKIASVEGVEALMPARSVDVMTSLNGSQYVMRMHSLNVDSAAKSIVVSDNTVESDDPSYLNRLVLSSGSWPKDKGEAVLSADRVMNETVNIGDTVVVEYGSTDLDDVLDVREYRVVGLAHSSLYTNDASMGATSLGSGKIQQYLYVADANFDKDMPFTEAYLKVKGADAELAGSDEYQARIDTVLERLEGMGDAIAADRLDELRADAQEELDDAKKEYDDAKKEADEKLADARAELEDAQREIDDNQKKLDDAAKQIRSGQRKLDAGEKELKSSEKQAKAGEKKWKKQRAQLVAAIKQAKAGKAQAKEKLPEVRAARKEAAAGVAQLDAGIATLKGKISELKQQRTAAKDGIAKAKGAREKAKKAAAKGDAKAAAAVEAATQQIAAAKQGIASLDAAIESLQGTNPATAADPNLASLTALRKTAQEGLAKADAALAQIEGGIAEADAGIAQARNGIAQGDNAIADAKAQIAAGKKTLADSRKKLSSARKQYKDGTQKLADARVELADGWAEYEEESEKAERELADALEEIQDAQDDIDSLEPPDIYVLDRTKNVGVQSVQADSERIDSIACVFPFVFFLVGGNRELYTPDRG